MVSFSWRKIKESTKPIKQFILEKQCDECKGNGKVPCATCNGKGSLNTVKVERGTCSICNGTGLVSVTCPICNGLGTISRTLRYTINGAGHSIQQRGIWFWARWFQIVSVAVRNLDDKAGSFTCVVVLKDTANTTRKRTLTISPGETKAFNLEFEVADKQGYATEYNVTPEQLPFACTTCSGTGRIQRSCQACQGLGTVPQQREVNEACNDCGGSGSKNCQTCNGSGRVRRL